MPTIFLFHLKAYLMLHGFYSPSQQDVNGTLPEMVWVSCNGKYAPDQEEMHEIVYTPQVGRALMCIVN